MKKLILFLVFIPTLLFSQGWEKTYGGDRPDGGYSVQQTIDGGYIITGWTASTYTHILRSNVYLIKTDSNGDTLWTKFYNGKDRAFGYSVQQTKDGGYVVTGSIESLDSESQDVYLIKTDSKGDTLWTKTYGGIYTDEGRSVQQTNDSGYVIAGFKCSNIYLIKTDNKGDTLWTKIYGGDNMDIGYSVQQTIDDGYIIGGTYGSYVYLIKTDFKGDTLWTKKLGTGYQDVGYSVQQTTDTGYIITGLYGYGFDVYLIKTDSKGDTLWTKTYGNSGNFNIGYSVQQTTDGGYIITGYTNIFDDGTEDVYLIKTDSKGDTLWTKTYGGENPDIGYSVQQTRDGGYIITGETILLDYNNDVYLIKTDDKGNILLTIYIPVTNLNRKLIQMLDLSGKEITNPAINQPYIEIFDDGTVQKKMIIK